MSCSVNRKRTNQKPEKNTPSPDHIIRNTHNAEHVLYAIDTLSKIYLNSLNGNEPLDLSDITTPWESIDNALENFAPLPDEQTIDALALADQNANIHRDYKIRTKPCAYIAAVVSKYFKTKGKQRNCLIVQQAFKNKLVDICRLYGIRMPKSKVAPEAWRKDWEPSTFKFDANIGKALVIEGFEHLFKILSRITYEYYFTRRMVHSLEVDIVALSA